MSDGIPINDMVRPEPRRDQYGRYKVVPPGGGKPKGYTRVTTVAKTLDNGGGLANWKAAMCAIGIIRQRGLRSQWETLMAKSGGDPWYGGLLPGEFKAETKKLVEHCADVGGANSRKDTGSSLHAITALVDEGQVPEHLTDETRRDIDAYLTGRKAAGIEIVGGWVETTVVLDEYEVAGTFDRLALVPGFDRPLVADLKTGGDLSYSMQPISVQLAGYSRANAVYVQGDAEDGSADRRLDMPLVDQEHGLIFWLDAGSAKLDLFIVDLNVGWDAFQHSMWARGWAKAKPAEVFTPLEGQLRMSLEARQKAPSAAQSEPDPAPVPTPSADRAALRAWLQARIDAIGQHPAAREYLLTKQWPPGVPTLRASADHTDDELDVIEQALDTVEGWAQLPFPPARPGPAEPEDARIMRLFPGTTDVTPKSNDNDNETGAGA